MFKQIGLPLLGLLLLLGAGCSTKVQVEDGLQIDTDFNLEEAQELSEEMQSEGVFQNRIIFTDIDDDRYGMGKGMHGVNDGVTKVFASFFIQDLPKDFFYEGWLVCNKTPYSTGELRAHQGLYENYFVSSELPPCQKYVLTIEPDDGDPAPAAHVQDGVFEPIVEMDDTIFEWNDEYFEGFNQ